MPDSEPGRHPWYETNLFWGSLGIAIGILLVVVAAMKHDLRFLLWFAFPFFVLSAHSWARTTRHKWWLTVALVVFIAAGIIKMYVWLEPAYSVSAPSQQSATVKPSSPLPPSSVRTPASGEPNSTVSPRSRKPKHVPLQSGRESLPSTQPGTGNQQNLQGGTGNQQTTIGGDVKQGGNGDCQQNVIGGNNNTNNCAPVPRSLTASQKSDLASAIAKIPPGIFVKVGSADSGEPHDYADQIRSAFGIERRVGTFFGWHPKGIYIAIFSADDIAAMPGQTLAFDMKQSGLNIVQVEIDPSHNHPGEITVAVGDQ